MKLLNNIFIPINRNQNKNKKNVKCNFVEKFLNQITRQLHQSKLFYDIEKKTIYSSNVNWIYELNNSIT